MPLSVKEVADTMNISIRAVQIRCKKEGIEKTNGTYLISDQMLAKWMHETKDEAKSETQNETDDLPEEELITEGFTPEEYDLFKFRLSHYQELKKQYQELENTIQDYRNEIQYLRNSLDKRDDQMDKLIGSISDSIKSIQQQNFLQAKEKGYDQE